MGGASFAGQVITWGVTIIVARLLTPADYGLVAISGIFPVFAHAICLMGVSAAVVQADEVSDYQVRALYGFSIFMGLFMFCIGLMAAPVMAWGFNEPRLTALVSFQNLVFIFGAPKSLLWSLLARETRFDTIAKVETGARILTSGCTLAMAVAGFGVWSLAAQWVFIEIFQLIGFSFVRRVRPTFLIRFTEIRDLLLFGIKVLLRNSVFQLYTSVDVIIFGKFASVSFLGGYSFAKQLTNMPFEKIIRVINVVMMPYLSKNKADLENFRNWTLRITDLQVFFLAPFFYLLFFCAEEAVLYLLGPGWNIAVLPLQVFCIANVFKLSESYVMVALTALGKVSAQVKFVFFQLLVVGSIMASISLWGDVELAVYVWVTVYPVLCYVFSKMLLKAIGLNLSAVFAQIRDTLFAQGIMIIALMVLEHFLQGPHWTTLGIKIICGCLVYLLALYFINPSKISLILHLVPALSTRIGKVGQPMP